MKIFSEDGQCFVDMEHALTINEVETFSEKLTPLLDTDKEFLIHCIDLKEIDASGLQILISLKKTLKEKNITFEITAGAKLKEFVSFFMLNDYFAGDII